MSIPTELIEIARAAGISILETRDRAVRTKTNGSPVTAADRASHELILERLTTLSELPVISEESESHPDPGTSDFWLVDPLDGTKELLKESGEFTVNIALVRGGRPVIGVVHLPATNVTYATGGNESFVIRNDRHDPIRVSSRERKPVRICVSRDHITDHDERIISRFPECERIPAGSSLKICLVAEGSADLYVRAGHTMEWDIAAAHAILITAGGTIRTTDGSELRYGKPDLLNPGFVAASRQELIAEALA